MPTSEYLGKGAYIGVKTESSWGTAAAPDSLFYRALPGVSLRRRRTRVPRNSLHVSGAGSSVPVQLSTYTQSDNVQGGFSVLAGYQSLGFWLHHILGASSTSGSGPNYVHTYSLTANSSPEGFTCKVGRGSGQSEQFEGCAINQASISIASGGQCIVNLSDIIGETAGARTTLGSASFSTDDVIIDHHQFGSFSWDGDNYSTLESMTINVNNNWAQRQRVGSLTSKVYTRGGPIEVTVDAVFEVDDQFYADWLAEVEDDVGGITATYDGNTYCTFNLQNFYIDDVQDSISGPGMVMANVRMVCQGDGSDHGLEVELGNQQSSAEGGGGRF